MFDPTKLKFDDIVTPKMQELENEFLDKVKQAGILPLEFGIHRLMSSLALIDDFTEKFKTLDPNMGVRLETCKELLQEFIAHCVMALGAYRLNSELKDAIDKVLEEAKE